MKAERSDSSVSPVGQEAEQTEGNSRAQLLALLDCPDVEMLRKRACALWNANYRDDGAVTSILAASLWLDEDVAAVAG